LAWVEPTHAHGEGGTVLSSRRIRTAPITPGDPAMSRWTLALFAFALGSLSTLALIGGAYYGAYYAIERAGRSQTPPNPPPVYSRLEFSRLVLGKSEEEVIEAVGRPDFTTEDADARYWHFKNRTHDPLTEEKDTDVQVVIKGGKVTNINY
jgi:hypothetical protein